MGNTSIEWTTNPDGTPGKTWNPLRGCSRVSEGCRHCYAETIAARFSDEGQPFHLFADRNKSGSKWTGKVELIQEHLNDPLKWRKPTRVFVNSMSDLFHEALPDSAIDQVFNVMEGHGSDYHSGEWRPKPWHTFQILTKRADRMRDYIHARIAKKQAYADQFKGCPTPEMRDSPASRYAQAVAIGTYFKHIWLGVSVENTEELWRIDTLRQVPAAVRFLSLEPLLGPLGPINLDGIHWVIVGGESGPGARPIHPDWACDIRDKCVAAGVPFFFKQWGAWLPLSEYEPLTHGWNTDKYAHEFAWRAGQRNESELPISCYRVGKKAAGALLDGKLWRQFPK